MNAREITRQKGNIQRSMTELGTLLGEISTELGLAKARIFIGDRKEIVDAVRSRTILEAQYAVCSKSLQEGQYALKHIEEEISKQIGQRESDRKLAMIEAIKRGERLPPCPQCGETKHVKMVADVEPRGKKPDFLRDPSDHNWYVSMTCEATKCMLRFPFWPEIKPSELVEEEDEEE